MATGERRAAGGSSTQGPFDPDDAADFAARERVATQSMAYKVLRCPLPISPFVNVVNDPFLVAHLFSLFSDATSCPTLFDPLLFLRHADTMLDAHVPYKACRHFGFFFTQFLLHPRRSTASPPGCNVSNLHRRSTVAHPP